MKAHSFQLIQNGIVVARVDAPTMKQAQQEINHYAFMYSLDGPVEIEEIKPKKRGSPDKARKGRS